MEQVIILGEIPGTHFQITFGWFALLASIGLCLLLYRRHRIQAAKLQKQLQFQFDVISLSSLDKA